METSPFLNREQEKAAVPLLKKGDFLDHPERGYCTILSLGETVVLQPWHDVTQKNMEITAKALCRLLDKPRVRESIIRPTKQERMTA